VIRDLTFKYSQFWTVHVDFSKHVTVSGKVLGEINNFRNWQFENVSLQDLEGNNYEIYNPNITIQ